jgi:hypothetical protein
MLALEIVVTSIIPRHGHRKHTRFGKAQAIIRRERAGATSIVGMIFACNRTEQPFVGGAGGHSANCAMMQLCQ